MKSLQLCSTNRLKTTQSIVPPYSRRCHPVSTAAEKREKKRIENEEKVQKATATLQQVVESNITPRNIRKVVKDALNMLNDKSISIGVRAANSISILEEVSQDPNMPSFSRVTIWSAVSTLESVRET